jgi:hypothetical protein
MMTRLLEFQRHLTHRRNRSRLAGQAAVVTLAVTLLLVPTTCAQMAGPHSLFANPTAGHVHHQNHETGAEAAAAFTTVADLEWHVVNGNGSPGWAVTESSPEDDVCPTTPGLRDLPTTMAMNAIGAPMFLVTECALDLPSADEPVAERVPALQAIAPMIDLPPPR